MNRTIIALAALLAASPALAQSSERRRVSTPCWG